MSERETQNSSMQSFEGYLAEKGDKNTVIGFGNVLTYSEKDSIAEKLRKAGVSANVSLSGEFSLQVHNKDSWKIASIILRENNAYFKFIEKEKPI